MLPAMGLRERKAARTREQIVDVALDLFIEQGYDETTMEQIAERAEVGNTTLYRYFPSKDLLILERLRQSIDLGGRLRARPVSEPLNVALGAAIRDSLERSDDEDGRYTELRRIVDNAPVPRARLWELAAIAQNALKDEIALRMDAPADDLVVETTAGITFAVFQIAAERWWAGDHRASPLPILEDVLRIVGSPDLVIPVLAP